VSEHKKFHQIALENGVYETLLTRKFARRKIYERQDPRIIRAVIPGAVAEIAIKAGTPVQQGDTIMTLEAMKMLNRIMAPQDGTIKAIRVRAGDKVSKGQVLIEME
jgi:biotin carboxyl carrier protein